MGFQRSVLLGHAGGAAGGLVAPDIFLDSMSKSSVNGVNFA